MTREWRLVAVGALIAAATAGAALYGSLPDQLPVHFSAGAPDRILSRGTVTALLLVSLVVLYLALEGLIWLFPQSSRSPRVRPVYSRFAALTLISAAAVAIAVFWTLPARPHTLDGLITIISGLALMAIGNYLPKVTPNLLLGVRTPWTLADDDVWFRTHRLAGPLFMIGGALLVGAGAAGWAPLTALVVVVPIGCAVTLYSFVIYRRAHRNFVHD
jgi:uncharacterized membrane protein